LKFYIFFDIIHLNKGVGGIDLSQVSIEKISTPFIDRRVAEGMFRELLGEHTAYRVLNIYGKSGSGKTTFVNEVSDKYLKDKESIISIKIDFRDRLLHKPQNAVMHIARELEERFNFNFMALWKAYAILWHKRYEHSPIMYAADLPYFNEIKKMLKPKKSRNILDIAKGIFGDKITKELENIKKLDAKKIEDKLYQFFAADLRRILKENNYKDCIIVLENIDTLGENSAATPCSKDEWVRDLITQISKDAIFLITSKEQLNWKNCNQSWLSVIKSYEMKAFIQKDSLRYLRLSGITDKELQQAVAQSAKGEAFWLSLATVAYSQKVQKQPINKGDILEQFIQTQDANMVKLLNILAHSRFFTEDLIDSIAKKFSIIVSKHTLEKLIHMPFVKKLDSERYLIDSILQEQLKSAQTQEQKVNYLSFMFSYYENILQSIDSQVVEATPQLVDEVVEEAWYHLNLINSEPLVHFEWLDYYIDRFFMYATWEPFLDRYNKIIPKLKKAEDKTSKDKLISLYNNLAGLYESLGDTNISRKYYNLVIKLNRPQLLSA
jgi:hypothetical protein